MPYVRILFAILLGLPLALQAAYAAFDALELDSGERGRGNVETSSSPSTKLAVLSEEEVSGRLVSPAEQGELLARALSALQKRPLDAQAFWVLGRLASARSGQSQGRKLEPVQADALFSAGHALSRRHSGVALEELRIASQSGNLQASLAALDRLLLVYPEHSNELTLLAGQLGDAELREALVPYTRRPWFTTLLRSATSENGDTDGAAVLLAGSGLSLGELSPGLFEALLDRLVVTGDVQTAQALAAKMGTSFSADPAGFGLEGSGSEQRFAPLAWRVAPPAAVIGSGEQTAVGVELAPGVGAVLLERVTSYPAGRYRLSFTVSGDGLAERPPLLCELDCLQSGSWQRHWSQAVPAGFGQQRYAMTPSWTAGCTAQRWRLISRPVDSQLGAGVRINDLALQPSPQS